MIVVSDASPLISLAAVDLLPLLRDLYGTVLIPPAVHQEIRHAKPSAPGAAALGAASWLRVESLRGEFLVRALEGELDRGEAEALALATEQGAELTLIDEHRGRKVASRLGIKSVGVLGVLVEAKRKGLLPEVKPALARLVGEASFRVSASLCRKVLVAVGEAEP